ncbi:MAG: cytochrome c biogenesis CcdA family protein [Elusimicrobiota bacterium]
MKQYILSFASGFLSFISPCVLPLIPGYLSLISGISATEIINGDCEFNKRKLILSSLFFVLGFSIVFTLLGVLSATAGGFIATNRIIIQKMMGVVMVILGLHISGFTRLAFLDYEKRKLYKSSVSTYFSAFITGISFALGWSPCIGPFLANILFLAATHSVFEGGFLLFLYSLGLGVPFIATAVLSSVFLKFISRNKKIFFYIEKIAGLILALIGVLIFFDKFSIE